MEDMLCWGGWSGVENDKWERQHAMVIQPLALFSDDLVVNVVFISMQTVIRLLTDNCH